MANTSNGTEISILVVDDDPICLAILEGSLQKLKHHVVAMKNPIDALCALRKKEKSFDLVLTDVHMPEMSGLELLNHVEEEFKLPVVLMSADRDKGMMLKGLEAGAAFYFVKPVSEYMLSRIWQYAIPSTKSDDTPSLPSVELPAVIESAPSNSFNVHDQHEVVHDDNNNNSSSSNNSNNVVGNFVSLMAEKNPFFYQNALKRSNLIAMGTKNASVTKKRKLVWTTSLHNIFLEAVNKLGLEKAMPKKILDLMKVPGLKRENVASHLQKYRIFLKRISEVSKSMENGIANDWNDKPFRSSFVLNEITFLTNNLHQQYRELLAQSRGQINEGKLHEKGQSFTQVNNIFGDYNPNSKANLRNTVVHDDQIGETPNRNAMNPNQLPSFRGCQQEFPRVEQEQNYGHNNGKFNNNNNPKAEKFQASIRYNYVGLRLDSNGELVGTLKNSPTSYENGGENFLAKAIDGISGFEEKRTGAQEELIYHHGMNYAYDYNKNNYSFENNNNNNNNNNAPSPLFDDVYLGIDDENNVYIPNAYDQNDAMSQENPFAMSQDIPSMHATGDELKELGIDFQNDQEILGNELGFGSFDVQGDSQGSVFEGLDEEILGNELSFGSFDVQGDPQGISVFEGLDEPILGNEIGFGSFDVQGDLQGSVFEGLDDEEILGNELGFGSFDVQGDPQESVFEGLDEEILGNELGFGSFDLQVDTQGSVFEGLDEEILGNELGFGYFDVQVDTQGSVTEGLDEEITLNDDISFESYFAQECEQGFNQQDGIDFNRPN